MAEKTVVEMESYNCTAKLDGATEVDNSTRKHRYQICAECEHLNQQWHRCEKCKCWMPVKARLPFTKCPEGKW